MAKQKGRWFRFYAGALDDPKVLMLSDSLFRTWACLMCVSAKEEIKDGTLLSLNYLSIALRLKPNEVSKRLEQLADNGLLDRLCGFKIHNWSDRQYESDVSSKRVKAFRERSMKRFDSVSDSVSVSVSESVSYSDSDSDLGSNTLIQSSLVNSKGHERLN